MAQYEHKKRARKRHNPDQARLEGRHFMEQQIDDQGRTMRWDCICCTSTVGRGGARARNWLAAKAARAARAGVPVPRGKTGTQYLHRKQTSYRCKNCQVPLCITPCMEYYHTEDDYHEVWLREQYYK